jgi:DNA-binding transcriptional LysR family regulator
VGCRRIGTAASGQFFSGLGHSGLSCTQTDIVAERFDAGIRLGQLIERDMIAVRVTDELPFFVISSNGANPRRQTILSGTLACVFDFRAAPTCPGFRIKRRDLEIHVEGRLGVNSVAVVRQAAIEGLALVQTPPIFIAGDLAARRLGTVLDEWAPTPATGFFLYYPSRRQMRPALKALMDFLRKERRGASQGASQ